MTQKHRISTNIGVDQKITVELKQDFDVLEILSLKFSQNEIYTSMCSDYGVVCGRVTANNGFGLGNVRVSIFVPLTTEDEDDPVISTLYPYKEVTDKDENSYRYNLLPSRQQHSGHANTGTFPDQTDILTREEVLEVYEKYYKYTVKTNSAGDFMIWGVPIGSQTIHMDADLSDVGCFSLRPYDFIRQGIGVDEFKNKYSFKASEDLDSLPQIISINKIIQVYPFWGTESLCEIGITRTDFDLSESGVKIQPKAYVIGGIYTDNGKNAINKNCIPRKKMGRKCDLVAKSGTIEAIRFMHIKDEENRPYLEYVDLNEDIPDDGGFVLPLEMNMDYVITNEFGENEITNDINKGIPTSACYRLRINLNDSGLSRARVNADYLVPNIREYQSGGTIDNRSYYFGTEWSGYPSNAVSANSDYGILCNEGGQFYPRDYFYRFTYNKVYTVSSLQSSFVKNGFFGKNQYLGLKELSPAEEDDCADNVTPPVNFGTKNYTFTLLIADFLLLLDYVIKFLYLSFLNFLIKDVLNPIAEIIVDLGGGRGARTAITKLQIATFTKLSLINYPECEECDSEFNQTTNQETPVPPYCSVGELSILGANGLDSKIVSSESYFGSVSCNSTNLISDRTYFINNQTSYILFEPLSYTYISLNSISYFFEEIDGSLVFVDGTGAFTTTDVTYDAIQIYDIASYDPNALQPTESGCDLYDTIYDDSLITGYYVPSGTAGASNTTYGSRDGRKWLGTLPPGVNPISTSIATQYKNKTTEPGYSTSSTDSRDLQSEYYNEAIGQKLPTSLRSEFKNGVFYMVLGTQSQVRLTGILQEYYNRKRVGKMFCGGIVNYAFIDNWLSGSLYFFQFKAKKVNRGVEGIIKYCRNVARFVEGPNRFYYRSAYTTNGTTFSFGGKNTLGTPTTFVDLGPRDEFIKEICIDKNLDPNCSVSRSIGPTSFKEFGELMGLAINYRMDVSGAKFGLNNFFDNFGSFTLKGYEQVLDGDLLQLISINSEAGIEEFDLQNPKYLGYSFQVLDPELYPQVFKIGYTGGNTGYWGALPVTMELDEDGERVRSCLNEPGRLGWDSNTLGSSQKVPFYLWDKKGTGFGGTSIETSDNQSWDYFTLIKTENGNLQPLQGMTYGYTATGSFSDTSDPYLLLPITNNFSGLTITGLNVTELVEFDIISTTDDHSNYNKEYPGFTYLFANSVTNPTTGTLYTRVGDAGNNGTTGWQVVSWNSGIDFILPQRQDYYGSNTKQILSTPFQFYFGLKAGKTGLDKFIDQYGPKGAFNLLECDTTSTSTIAPTVTPSPTPTNTPTPTPTATPTPTPTLNSDGLNLMSGVKSGVTLNLLCGGGGSSVNIYFSGTSIQLGEKLYSNNTLPNPTPVINGRYYYPTYETIYVVTGGLGAVTSTEYCPSPTPLEYTIENIWTSDPLTSNPTEQDLTYAVLDACNGTSNINSSAGLNGTATMTGWGNNICNALRVYNIPSLILSEVTSNGIIILRQTINNFDGSGGNKTWYRKYQRSLTKDSEDRYYFTPLGGCAECGVELPTPTPVPQITVNIYGYQSAPYDENFNNAQLVYQTYITPNLGSINTTSSGIKKILTESGSILATPSVGAGGNLNLGVFKRVENDICDYMEVTANVFASGTFDSDRFNNSSGSLTQQTGCSQQGSIYGITISVSQSIDVYVTFGLPGFWSGLPPLPCLTTNE